MSRFLARYKNVQPISLSLFNLIFSLWIAFALNIGFLQQLKILTPYQGLHSLLFIAASAFVLTALYNLIFQVIHWKFNAKWLAAIWIVLGGMSAYFVNSLGITISPDQIQNMLQTDTREALDLMTLTSIMWCIAFVVLPLIVVYVIEIKHEMLGKIILKKTMSSTFSLMVIASLMFVYYVDYAAIFRENRDLKGMISPQNVITSSISYYRHLAPEAHLPLIPYGQDAHLVQHIDLKHHPKLMVLVIGETARAESFALNGYQRPTNPELSKLDIINFNQVSSCGTATAVSVPCMFSGMPRQDYDERLASHREGLLDIAKRVGYQVTWIDNNSGCKKVCDHVNTFVIPQSLQDKWCDAEGECHDEILVDALKAYVQALPKNDTHNHLIVLHQMGSHGPAYYKRSTPQYQPFKPFCQTNAIQGCNRAELINSYDNSIVYTDHVLSSIIQELKQISHYQTGFWYLSDHGESTGEHGLYLHGAPYRIAPTQQTHVPMLMWFSDAWKNHQAHEMTCLNAQKSAPLSQDNLFPTLLSLLDIKSNVINPNLNIIHHCNPTKLPRT